jgi:Zn-dependent protease with chaperone function
MTAQTRTTAGIEPPPPSAAAVFTLLSDTLLRFGLLVAAALAASGFIGGTMYFAVRGNALRTTLAVCTSLVGPPPLEGELAAWLARLDGCVAPEKTTQLLWTLIAAGAVVVVAVGLYVLPTWRLRRRGVRPVHGIDGLDRDLAVLSREVGLAQTPRVVWDLGDISATGFALGGLGRRLVVLSGGLLHQFRVARPAFRAIVRHEFAHLRNRDVGPTYFARAVWLAFVGVSALPFVVIIAWRHDWQFGLATSWRAAVLAGVVYLTRNAMLRSRELYADARAHACDPRGALPRVLARLAPVTRWRGLVGVHPRPERRRQALTDPSILLRPSIVEASAVGFITSSIYSSAVAALSLTAALRPAVSWWAALLVAPLTVGVLGTGLWREVLAVHPQRVRRDAAGHGLAIGAGILAGQSVSVSTAPYSMLPAAPWSIPLGDQQSPAVGFGVTWSVLMLGGLVFLAWWTGANAIDWRQTCASSRPGHLRVSLALAVTAVVFTAWMGVLFALRDALPLLDTTDPQALSAGPTVPGRWATSSPIRLLINPVVVEVLTQPLVGIAVVLLWAYPLAAAWIPPSAQSRPTNVTFAVLVGIGGGASCAALLLLLRLVLLIVLPEQLRGSPDFGIAFYLWHLLIALAVQVLVAAIIAACRPRMAVPHALLAACLTATLAAAAAITLTALASCVPALAVNPDPAPCGSIQPGTADWHMLLQFVIEGALLTIPTAITTRLLVPDRSRPGQRRQRHPNAASPGASGRSLTPPPKNRTRQNPTESKKRKTNPLRAPYEPS